ncbi:butyrophilin subfamily 1 member A1-like [Ambystoma mexicanum]|uniref:butyrophilin subfamily 1 member A1-like n=1 Tax=Ambystoma mexicanum TaxID=8296 RepID=UPI0037E992C0
MMSKERFASRIPLAIFILLHVSPLHLASISVIGPAQPLVVFPGEDALLLCHLSPQINAENMTMRWYKGHYYDAVHVRRNGQDWNEEKMAAYRRRTELIKGGISVGDLSLIIHNVSSSDSGQYSCLLDAGPFYKEAKMELKVTASISVIGPAQPQVVLPGQDALMPCHLSPKINAENMTIRWYKGHYYDAVHVRQNGQDSNEEKMAAYRRRTELIRGGVRVGDLSLIIRNVSSSDSGQYSCLFDAGAFYEEATVELKVAAVGSSPFLYLEESQNGGILIACTSSGWYPKPESLWRNDNGDNLTESTEVKNPGQSSWFHIKTTHIISGDSQKLSCRIRNPALSQWKESTIHISESFVRDLSNCSIERISITAVFAALATCISLLAVYIFKKQGLEELSQTLGRLSEERDWRRAKSYAAEVTLDPDTAQPWLVMSEDGKSVKHGDSIQNLPDTPERFNYSMCILGRQRLRSGRHYWEIEVGDKSGWSVGVYDETVSRKGGLVVKPEGGFWLVELKDKEYNALTVPRTRLDPRPFPRVLGLFLDYEAGRLSVYNAQNRSLLYTFSGYPFPPVLRPFLNPGRIDKMINATPMKILPVSRWD